MTRGTNLMLANCWPALRTFLRNCIGNRRLLQQKSARRIVCTPQSFLDLQPQLEHLSQWHASPLRIRTPLCTVYFNPDCLIVICKKIFPKTLEYEGVESCNTVKLPSQYSSLPSARIALQSTISPNALFVSSMPFTLGIDNLQQNCIRRSLSQTGGNSTDLNFICKSNQFLSAAEGCESQNCDTTELLRTHSTLTRAYAISYQEFGRRLEQLGFHGFLLTIFI